MMPSERESGAALVTGAAAGLGEGIARRLGRDGWSVLLFDVSESVSDTAAALVADLELPEGRLIAIVGDVRNEDQVEAAVAAAVNRFGGLDLAVANAGVGGVEVDLVDLEARDFDDIIAVNLRGVYLTCKAAGRVMRSDGGGSIVTISSIFAQDPFPRTAAYSASKAGVIALTEALALELAPHGVRVNSIAPGYMATEMQWAGLRARAAHAGITFEEERKRVVAMVPLGRHGTGNDVGAAVAFLASDDSSYITGHTLGVNGGVVRR
jgi:NAD(P)-dependent dehydrogenase (short-subunit alcohol dehydrogenase family)